jgi:undecaprenyl-diphosphatase
MDGFLVWLLMGLVQGLTDIFPISSTAHLALLRQLLNAQSFDLPLAAGLHSGSLLAIGIFFRKELGGLWKEFVKSLAQMGGWITGKNAGSFLSAENMTPFLYGLSLIPVALEGLTLRLIAQETFSHRYLPLIFLMLNGVIILVTALIVRGERTVKELRWNEFLLIGLIQGLAVLPGISRLGLVLCAGLWRRLKWQEALKLTFLLSLPVVLGALVLESGNILSMIEGDPKLIATFLAGSLLSCLGSWFSLKLLTSRLLERRKLALFGYYCLMLGSFSSLYLYFWK